MTEDNPLVHEWSDDDNIYVKIDATLVIPRATHTFVMLHNNLSTSNRTIAPTENEPSFFGVIPKEVAEHV